MAEGRGSVWARNYYVPDGQWQRGGPEERTGICLSGGGIRSATFCLGARQVLADAGVVARARFLASVSGGGYLAGAYQMLRKQPGPKDASPLTTRDAFAPGSPEEDHLRRHGKYLADGAKEWTLAVLVVVRNVAFNLGLLYAALYALATVVAGLYVLPPLRGWTAEVVRAAPSSTWLPPGNVWSGSEPWAVLLPLGLAVFLWALSGWPTPASGGVPPFRTSHALHRAAGIWTGVTAAVTVAVLGVPLLVSVAQASGQAYAPSAPELGVVVAAVTAGTTLWNMAARTGSSSGTMLVQRAASVATFATRAALSLLVVLALATVVIAAFGGTLADAFQVHLAGGPALAERWWWTGVAALAVATSWVVVDQTRLSLHPFYKRRLSTAFSVERHPGSPSGARERDYDEATLLSTYAEPVRDPLGATEGTAPPDAALGPQLLLCASASVSGQDIAPPGRRVTPFVFSSDAIGGPGVGYVPTTTLEKAVSGKPYATDITTLAAMALSGAAFASSAGRMSGPFNILLSVTNARLGAWLPNPARWDRSAVVRRCSAHEASPAAAPAITASSGWQRTLRAVRHRAGVFRAVVVPPLAPPGDDRWPRLLKRAILAALSPSTTVEARVASRGRRLPRIRRLQYLLWELFGRYSPNSPFLLVTDGGHYDNLGLVELLRRRCTEIWCLDASGDRSLADTLAQSAALAYEELGVEVRVDGVPLAPASAESGKSPNDRLRALEARTSPRSVISATVHYPPLVDAEGKRLTPEEPGVLVIGKAVLTADLPFPLRCYAARELRFPGDTTADQWFDVGQFDAYEALGREVGKRMLRRRPAVPAQRTPATGAAGARPRIGQQSEPARRVGATSRRRPGGR